VLAASAAVAALAWSASLLLSRKPTWTVTWVEPLLLAVVGVGLLQITPLPPALLHFLSPQHGTLLPLWSGNTESSGAMGTWQTLSLNVGETRQSIIVGLSYIALFFVATQRLRRVSDIERLLKWIAAITGLMALFGVVQWLTSNGKFFWFYDYPLTTSAQRVKGAFTNRNHFAEFMALGCAPLLLWILKTLEKRSVTTSSFGSRAVRSNTDTLLGGLLLLLGVLVFAALFSLSRGGTVALGVSLVVTLSLLFRAGRLSGRVVGVLLGMSLVAGSLFLMFGAEKVANRLDNWESEERLAVWDANSKIVRDFPFFGTGMGSHSEVCPIYFNPPYADIEFTHAENSYLQVASECGLLGLSLALAGVACCVVWCVRASNSKADSRIRVLSAVVSASLAANLVHAVVDYSWFVPGLMVIVLPLVACARRLDQLSSEASRRSRSQAAGVPRSNLVVPRGLGIATAAVVVSASLWAFPQLQQATRGEPYWFDYLRSVRNQREALPASMTEAEDPEVTEAEQLSQFKQRLVALSTAAKLAPSKARVQMRLASTCLKAFDHLQLQTDDPMSLSQLRDAALASQFDSTDAMHEWLDRAVGKNVKYLEAAARHAKKAVQLCPLQGEAYVHLAGLRFLEDLDPQHSPALLQQAQLVRPLSATVQYAVGLQHWLDGQKDEALQSWKLAFHQDRAAQDQILSLLAGNAPAQAIYLNAPPPTDENSPPPGLSTTSSPGEVRSLPLPEYEVIARAYAAALKKELENPECDQPINQLIAAAAVYHRLQDPEATEACLQRALEIDRSSFMARKMMGVFLYEQGQFARASECLNWCVKISPTDRWLRSLAEDAISRSLRTPSEIQPIGFDSLGRRKF
ncbi:MAG: O-antigen polymerase, partial [Planctomycetota bacterium]